MEIEEALNSPILQRYGGGNGPTGVGVISPTRTLNGKNASSQCQTVSTDHCDSLCQSHETL